MRRSISARSVTPAGFASRGHELAVVEEAPAGHHFQAGELGERVGVVVDADVEEGILLLVVDQERRRLPAALVAARLLAGAQRREEAPREGADRAATARRPPRLRSITAGPASMLPATEKRVADEVPAPVRRMPSPVKAAKRPARSMTWTWRWLAALVGRRDDADHVLRRGAGAQELEAAIAVERD